MIPADNEYSINVDSPGAVSVLGLKRKVKFEVRGVKVSDEARPGELYFGPDEIGVLMYIDGLPQGIIKFDSFTPLKYFQMGLELMEMSVQMFEEHQRHVKAKKGEIAADDEG